MEEHSEQDIWSKNSFGFPYKIVCYTNSATCSTPVPCPQTGLANLSKTTFRTHSKSSRNKTWQTGNPVSILWRVRYCNPTLHLTWCTTLRLCLHVVWIYVLLSWATHVVPHQFYYYFPSMLKMPCKVTSNYARRL